MPKPQWQIAEEDFANHWKGWGKEAYVYHFQDTREAMGSLGSRRVFTQSRPSDFLVTFKGQTFFAEVKSSSDKCSFSLANIQPIQKACCKQVHAARGEYYFFIKSEVWLKWYRVPGGVIVGLMAIEQKSVRWEDLKQFEYVI